MGFFVSNKYGLYGPSILPCHFPLNHFSKWKFSERASKSSYLLDQNVPPLAIQKLCGGKVASLELN
jgi:hypothetical protein